MQWRVWGSNKQNIKCGCFELNSSSIFLLGKTCHTYTHTPTQENNMRQFCCMRYKLYCAYLFRKGEWVSWATLCRVEGDAKAELLVASNGLAVREFSKMVYQNQALLQVFVWDSSDI